MRTAIRPLQIADRSKIVTQYDQVRHYLDEAQSIEECVRWRAVAEAIDAYYRHLNDDTLVYMARRIKLRALRGIGKFLLESDRTIEIETHLPRGGHAKKGGTILGEEHGLNPKTRNVARKLAGMAESEFNEMVEQEIPPSRTSFTGAYATKEEPIGVERFEHCIRMMAGLLRRYDQDELTAASNTVRADLHYVVGRLVEIDARHRRER